MYKIIVFFFVLFVSTSSFAAVDDINSTLKDDAAAEAQFAIGLMYYEGQGVPQDYKEALKWYRLAAEQGKLEAQYNLGLMYAKGGGVPQDFKEAVKWISLAAGQGDADAQYMLGLMYANGDGVPQHNVEAYAWATVARANGYDAARELMSDVAKVMTPVQIEKAQELAKKYFK